MNAMRMRQLGGAIAGLAPRHIGNCRESLLRRHLVSALHDTNCSVKLVAHGAAPRTPLFAHSTALHSQLAYGIGAMSFIDKDDLS